MTTSINKLEHEITHSAITKQPGSWRGRKPKITEDEVLRLLQTNYARQAYLRLSRAAKKKVLEKANPRLWADINQWLYEVRYGKPKVTTYSESASIQFNFKVISRKGQEIEEKAKEFLESREFKEIEGKIDTEVEEANSNLLDAEEVTSS